MSTVHTQTGEDDTTDKISSAADVTNGQYGLENKGNSTANLEQIPPITSKTEPPSVPKKFVKETKISKRDQLKLSEAFTALCESEADGLPGKVSRHDVKKCLFLLGIAVSDERISQHCELDDVDGELKMNYRAFEKCYTEIIKSQPVTLKQVNKFYKQLDCLEEGHVTIAALRSWCFSNDLVLPEDELELMVGSADLNKDGKITEKEFIKLMNQINTLRPTSRKK